MSRPSSDAAYELAKRLFPHEWGFVCVGKGMRETNHPRVKEAHSHLNRVAAKIRAYGRAEFVRGGMAR